MKRTGFNAGPELQTVLFCTPGQWLTAVLAGLAACGVAWPWYKEVSIWVGPIIALMVISIFHLVYSSPLIVPFPQIAILITGLQYVLAAWLSFYFPPRNPNYDIGNHLAEYLAYGSGATFAFALGWGAVLIKSKERLCAPARASRKLLNELDALLWFGLICGLLARFIATPSLAFLLVLLANLRYVGAFGRMLVLGDGWWWRVGLTLAIEVLIATGQGMFHTLLLWSASAFAIYLYRLRPKRGVAFAWICLGLLLLPVFQEAKWRIRGKVWFGELAEVAQRTPGALPQFLATTVDWVTYLVEGIYRSLTLTWDEDFLADALVRYNQGWIVNQVMQQVPAIEPFAKGETLLTAAKAALVPRVFAPDKYLAGGKLHMARFAGMEMEGASMNLGFAGEMYANFGYDGGIAGCFVYAAVLGLMVRWVVKRASLAPLWWMFVPYVGVTAIKAEEGVAEVLNWVFKAGIVVVVVYWLFPAIRAALSSEPQAAEALKSGNWESRKQKSEGGGRRAGILNVESRKQKAEMEEPAAGRRPRTSDV